MAGQGQAASGVDGNAFGEQQLALDPVAAFTAGGEADLAAGIHHPLPGNGRGQRQAPQGPAHLARRAIGPDQLGDLAVGGELAGRDAGDGIPYPLIKGALPPMPLLPRRFERLKAVLDRRMGDLTVVLEHVDKPHNLSAILRSCDAVGVLEAHVVSMAGRTPTLNCTAKGSEKWVPLHRHNDSVVLLQGLKDRGFRLFGTHLSVEAVDYRRCDFTGPCAFVLGAEKWGLSAEATALVDQPIVIPMQGMVQSLNVSVACATLLFEALRQRQAAGVLPERGEGLEAERYRAQLLEWAYPEVAAWCRREGRPYPALDAEGAISENLPRTIKLRY